MVKGYSLQSSLRSLTQFLALADGELDFEIHLVFEQGIFRLRRVTLALALIKTIWVWTLSGFASQLLLAENNTDHSLDVLILIFYYIY